VADTEELNRLRSEVAELHRLRAEVALLRRQKEDADRLQRDNARLNVAFKPPAADDERVQTDSMARCFVNMRLIEGAKDQWALEHKKRTGAVVNADELADYLKDNAVPTCPAGGTYTLSQVGELSSCSVHGSLPRETTPEELAAIQEQFNNRLKVFPLIQFQDAPLHDVVQALARQANLNLVFDPEVAARLDPLDSSLAVSIRLENLTAEEALRAILSTNGLRLVETVPATWRRSSDLGNWLGDVLGVTRK
jgi:hypothetical protein